MMFVTCWKKFKGYLKRDSYRRIRIEIAVNRVLAWEIEIIVPCHGDVIRGEELCRNVLTKHFLA